VDRKKLMRQLRRVTRLGRYHREVGQRLQRLCDSVQVTPEELALLVQETDGYVLVCDARERGAHVTLSDADEISKQRAREREAKRDAAAKLARDKRQKQIEAERAERKTHKVERRKKQLLELIQAIKGGG
jgi:hypothetical protein